MRTDFWNLYEEDIERAAALNVKFFRLSIEWSRIQPRRGEVDLEAVQRYHDIFDVLDRCACATLHINSFTWAHILITLLVQV